MNQGNNYTYTPLKEPIRITEQEWPEGTLPLVTTRTITFMHESFIRECIEGILMQKTTFPVEVVIHDDASTDKTADIVREYQAKHPRLIKAIYQTENQFSKPGKGTMRDDINKAIRGKYIALCEGDDYWTDPLKLQKQVDFLEDPQNSQVVAVATNATICDYQGIVKGEKQFHVVRDNQTGMYNLHDFFLEGHNYPTLTVVFRNIIPEIMPDLEKLANPFLGDWTLWVLLHLRGDFYYLDESTACYRINPSSLTHTVNAVERWKHDFIIRQKLRDILPADYHHYLNTDWYAYYRISLACRFQHNYRMFLFYLARSSIANPWRMMQHIAGELSKKSRKSGKSWIIR